MKKIITSCFTLVLSPLIMAGQLEDASTSSKERMYLSNTTADQTKSEKLAMYLYKKNEEETIRPNVEIRLPPSSVKKELEPTPIEDNKDITLWGEELPSEYVILGE